MALARFFAAELPESGMVNLSESESHHAVRVLRCALGDDVLVFDGTGFEAFGTIAEVTKRSVRVRVAARRFSPRDHEGRLHFAIALPKGERQRNVIEKLVELGVDSLTPVETTRSVARVDESAFERLARYGVEACKQCQRNRFMTIHPSMSIEQFVHARLAAEVWLLHPSPHANPSGHVNPIVARLAGAPNSGGALRSTAFLVGPEGGFTDEEVLTATRCGASLMSLGDRILRVETAVAVAATIGDLWLGTSQ